MKILTIFAYLSLTSSQQNNNNNNNRNTRANPNGDNNNNNNFVYTSNNGPYTTKELFNSFKVQPTYQSSPAERASSPILNSPDLAFKYIKPDPVIMQKPKPKKKPNIVVLMSDDQDVVFGSLAVMKNTHKWLINRGTRFDNAFVTTPICCPSRASYLTGRYMHNHGVSTNNLECYSPHWIQHEEPKTFGNILKNAGYHTNFVGKYMNEYNGTLVPVGWDNWVALIKNSRYYNYTIARNFPELSKNFNPNVRLDPKIGNQMYERHGDSEIDDYFTDVIAMETERVLKNWEEKEQNVENRDPLLIYANFPAPHGVEYAPKKYQQMYLNNKSHRYHKAYNVTGDNRKNWFLKQSEPLTDDIADFTDKLHTRRLQTLVALDEAIDRIFKQFEKRGLLDNTYFIYASDHGYHMGHYGLAKGKSLPYEFDIRVPFMVRGPGVPHGYSVKHPVSNIDLAPTILDIAGVKPDKHHIDGRSILPLLKNQKFRTNSNLNQKPSNIQQDTSTATTAPWRDTILIERGKTLSTVTSTIPEKPDRQQELEKICSKTEYREPCTPASQNSPGQEWFCRKTKIPGTQNFSYRLRKCRKSTYGIKGINGQCFCKPCTCKGRNGIRHKGMLVADGSCHCLKHFPNINRKRKSSPIRRRNLMGFSRNPNFRPNFLRRRNNHHQKRVPRANSAIVVNKVNIQKSRKKSRKSNKKSQNKKNNNNSDKKQNDQDSEHAEDKKQRMKELKRRNMEKNERIKKLQEKIRKLEQEAEKKATRRKIQMIRKHRQKQIQEWRNRQKLYFRNRKQFYQNVCMCDNDDDIGSSVYKSKKGPFNSRKSRNRVFKSKSRKSKSRNNKNIVSRAYIDTNPLSKNKSNKNLQDWKDIYGKTHSKKKTCKDINTQLVLMDSYFGTARFNIQKRNYLEKKKFECDRHEECNQRGMKCSLMDNHHWKKGEPQYEGEKFCYCQSASNNTYMCLRTVNETHNFMYCVFENEKMDYGRRSLTEYYDYKNDGANVMNQFYKLRSWEVAVFDKMLDILKGCKGMVGCNMAKGKIFDPIPKKVENFQLEDNNYIVLQNNQLDIRKKIPLSNNNINFEDKQILTEIENLIDSAVIDDKTNKNNNNNEKCGRRCRLEKQRVFCKKKKNKQKEQLRL